MPRGDSGAGQFPPEGNGMKQLAKCEIRGPHARRLRELVRAYALK